MMPTLPSSSSSSCCISSTYYYCYLLRSVATKNSTASYIGFTTNPSNRLRQHNGEVTAGAQRTSKRRPWKFVCIVSGFPNKIVALQFEWQWQHMHRSRLFKSPSKPSTTATTTTATAITVSTTTTSTSPLTKKNVSRKKSSNRSPGGVSIVEEANNQTNDHENNAIPLKIRRKRKRILTPHNHTKYTGKLYLLSQLLNHPIWKQLQLIVYFLDPEIEKPFYQYLPKQQFSICEMSMESITSLQSEIKKKTKGSDLQLMDQNQTLNSFCLYCNQTISSSSLSFLGVDAVANSSQRVIRSKNNQNDEGSNQSMNNPVPHRIWKCPHCCYSHHLLCTAREAVKIPSNSSSSSSEALQDVPLIPLTGKCENCHCKIKWPDIIRKYLLPMTSSSFTLHHSQNGNLSDGDSSGSSETSDDEEDEEQILDEDGDDDEDMQSDEEHRMDELPEPKRLKRTSKNVILIEDEALNGEDGPFHSPVEARFNSNSGALLLDEDDYLYHEAHHQDDYYFSEENY